VGTSGLDLVVNGSDISSQIKKSELTNQQQIGSYMPH